MLPYHKTYEVVGYTYETGLHCPDCAEERFGHDKHGEISGPDSEENPVTPIFVGGERPFPHFFCDTCGREV